MGRIIIATTLLVASLVAFGSMATRTLASAPQYGDIMGPVTATSMGIKMPESKAVYDNLSDAQKAYLARQIQSRRDAYLRMAVPTILATASATTVTRGKLRAPYQSHVTVEGRCSIYKTDAPGGSWMNGYGSTNSFGVGMYVLTVDGAFYKNGAFQADFGKGCWACSPPRTFVDDATQPIWKYAWDSANWVTESTHNAQSSSGHWDLGPNASCYVAAVY